MTYSRFKKFVLDRCGRRCENPHCDADANQVHHFLKTSTYPEYKLDPRNGMGSCGMCHSEIERRIREGEDWLELVPLDRWFQMLEVARPGSVERI